MRLSACPVWHFTIDNNLYACNCDCVVTYLVTLSLVHAALSNGALRLVNRGSTEFGGRLEFYYNNQWGIVCNDRWDLSDATVACRQMGFVDVTDRYRYGFGSGASSQSIWLDDVECNGSESRLIDCSHAGIGIENCDHYDSVGIVCTNGELGWDKSCFWQDSTQHHGMSIVCTVGS